MRTTTHRRLCGALGVALLVLVGGGVALVGAGLFRAPTTAVQVVLLGATGVLDVAAAFENPVTDRIEWFRLGGLANVTLGLALPVGVLGWAGGAGGTFLLVVTTLGGLSLAALGVDVALYAGAHVYERPLDARPE